MKKRIFPFVLVIALLGCMFPMTAVYAKGLTATKNSAGILSNTVPQFFKQYNLGGNQFFNQKNMVNPFYESFRPFEVNWYSKQNTILRNIFSSNAIGKKVTQTAKDKTSKAVDTSCPCANPKNKSGSSCADCNSDRDNHSNSNNNQSKQQGSGKNTDSNVKEKEDNTKDKNLSVPQEQPAKGKENVKVPGNTKQFINNSQEIIIGMHTYVDSDRAAQMLLDNLKALSEQGINLLIAEVNFDYQYKSHPELGKSYGLSFKYAREIAKRAKELGIHLVPEFNCLGHQSWEGNTEPLLSVYPELDETPGKYPNNKGIYCRSWCPLNEKANALIFDLIDELMDAFQADAIHVGLDEVFIIGDKNCPRCKGKDPGDLFAKAINDLYQYFVTKKGAVMFMWADRLLDGKALGNVYSEWDSSYNGTFTALNKIPKDIILCDWHYEVVKSFPSIKHLTGAGFKVLTSSWHDVNATEKLIQATLECRKTNPNVLGHLYTIWGDVENKDMPKWKPMTTTLKMLK